MRCVSYPVIAANLRFARLATLFFRFAHLRFSFLWQVAGFHVRPLALALICLPQQESGMPHSIFIETTIPSLYVSRPSRDLRQLAQQDLTREWWGRTEAAVR